MAFPFAFVKAHLDPKELTGEPSTPIPVESGDGRPATTRGAYMSRLLRGDKDLSLPPATPPIARISWLTATNPTFSKIAENSQDKFIWQVRIASSSSHSVAVTNGVVRMALKFFVVPTRIHSMVEINDDPAKMLHSVGEAVGPQFRLQSHWVCSQVEYQVPPDSRICSRSTSLASKAKIFRLQSPIAVL